MLLLHSIKQNDVSFVKSVFNFLADFISSTQIMMCPKLVYCSHNRPEYLLSYKVTIKIGNLNYNKYSISYGQCLFSNTNTPIKQQVCWSAEDFFPLWLYWKNVETRNSNILPLSRYDKIAVHITQRFFS